VYNRELHVGRPDLPAKIVDVLDPFFVIVEVIGGNADDFHVALSEIFRTAGDLPQLGGADGGEI
jgi:hypothetical protein